jgi:hypothetical protein
MVMDAPYGKEIRGSERLAAATDELQVEESETAD